MQIGYVVGPSNTCVCGAGSWCDITSGVVTSCGTGAWSAVGSTSIDDCYCLSGYSGSNGDCSSM
jgi:hypothetical protein